VEGIATGLVAVTTDLPELRSITQDGENGLLFQRRDLASLNEKVSELIKKPEK
jgi:glycosyltransferase involved in cell wall biosynthesis